MYGWAQKQPIKSQQKEKLQKQNNSKKYPNSIKQKFMCRQWDWPEGPGPMQGGIWSPTHRGVVLLVKGKIEKVLLDRVNKLPSIPNCKGLLKKNNEFNRPIFKLRNYISSYLWKLNVVIKCSLQNLKMGFILMPITRGCCGVSPGSPRLGIYI